MDPESLLARPLSRRQLVALDAIVAAAYGLLLSTLVLAREAGPNPLAPVPGAVLVVAMVLPLSVRRLWPVPAFCVSVIATLLALVAGVVIDDFVGSAFVLYVVALSDRRQRRQATIAVAAITGFGLVLLVGAGSTAPFFPAVGAVAVGAVFMGGAWTLGQTVRERRRLAALASAERIERALTDERIRIARELHDVVGHGLSAIVIRAATANHVVDRRPDVAREALQAIEATGRDALAEMRQLVALLRDGAEMGLSPAPDLRRLPELARHVAVAGVDAEIEVRVVGAMPESVELAAYRIVQEALTNVAKHAAPAKCQVTITAGASQVDIEVQDDGRRAAEATPDGTPGHGLVGMRERVRVLGGDFDAGSLPGHGFFVRARIPYTDPRGPEPA